MAHSLHTYTVFLAEPKDKNKDIEIARKKISAKFNKALGLG